MSTLVVVGYDDPCKAEEVRLKLWKLQNEYQNERAGLVLSIRGLLAANRIYWSNYQPSLL